MVESILAIHLCCLFSNEVRCLTMWFRRFRPCDTGDETRAMRFRRWDSEDETQTMRFCRFRPWNCGDQVVHPTTLRQVFCYIDCVLIFSDVPFRKASCSKKSGNTLLRSQSRSPSAAILNVSWVPFWVPLRVSFWVRPSSSALILSAGSVLVEQLRACLLFRLWGIVNTLERTLWS